MLTARFDEKLGIVRSVSAGFTSQDEAEAYMRHMLELMPRARARHGRVLHLVDARDSPVQPQPVVNSFNSTSEKHHKEEDKTAIFMQSALVKMQSRRTAMHGQYGRFDSEDEALSWLLD